MTTKIKIEFPADNHAPYVDVFTVDPDGDSRLYRTLSQGEVIETYVHKWQSILLKERFDN